MTGELALLVAALVAAPPAHGLEALGWMSGSWQSAREPMMASGPHWREEIWSGADRTPLMVGLGRGQRGFGRYTYEYLRLEEDERGITLHMQAMSSPAVRYRLVESSANEAVFEGAATNVPQRIVYRRAGDTLTITGTGLDGRTIFTQEYMRHTGRRQPAN